MKCRKRLQEDSFLTLSALRLIGSLLQICRMIWKRLQTAKLKSQPIASNCYKSELCPSSQMVFFLIFCYIASLMLTSILIYAVDKQPPHMMQPPPCLLYVLEIWQFFSLLLSIIHKVLLTKLLTHWWLYWNPICFLVNSGLNWALNDHNLNVSVWSFRKIYLGFGQLLKMQKI